DALRTAKQDHRRCERCWRQTGLSAHQDVYTEKKTEVNCMIKEARTLHYKTLICENQADPR
ncbi:hypothetical protein CAPTEDRAFT_80285, partial [Capitella teleta]